ncbi:MAG: hypothetical protein B6D46_16470 [Polyangiaceae bacterium UTPRO1]|jgi:hypothetical protein|nr:MAG: hypothetical protein B6D46_16470 [Polyangiaceae bacterium UTPRO1]
MSALAKGKETMRSHVSHLGLLVVGIALLASSSAHAAQRTFPSADAAVAALVAAATAGDRKQLDPLFGSGAEQVLSSGDPVADREARELFAARALERTHIERVGDDFAVLSVGDDDWPFPIPLIRESAGWRFDTEAGKTELLNRRIGRNELFTIQVCQEYVAAQRDYAARARATGGVYEFAQRLRSTPGKRDGLYWEAADGDAESPLGPFLAYASREGYRPGQNATPQPYHGYVYKPLLAAGSHAPGGAREYVKDGRMTRGFALLAYPVRYGSSGVMTFLVNEQGIVFQKDLGPQTVEIAAKITSYDPDDSWEPTE